jgi:hypothetical protein
MQEHEDAHEFLHKLQTKVDAYGPNIKAEYKPMSAAMGGVMVTTFTCSTVDYQSRTIEPFAPLQICVDVQVRLACDHAQVLLDVLFGIVKSPALCSLVPIPAVLWCSYADCRDI